MGTSRLNNRDRLFIRIAKDGTAIANSALWRSQIPRSQGRWKDITSCVLGCCGTSEPTESSFLILQGSGLNASSEVTAISFPGYSWEGSVSDNDFLVIPLPYDFNETITFTCSVILSDMDYVTSTVQGDGTIETGGIITTDPDPQTFTLTVTSTPGSQYLVLLTDD